MESGSCYCFDDGLCLLANAPGDTWSCDNLEEVIIDLNVSVPDPDPDPEPSDASGLVLWDIVFMVGFAVFLILYASIMYSKHHRYTRIS